MAVFQPEWSQERALVLDRLESLKEDHRETREQLSDIKETLQQLREDMLVREAERRGKTHRNMAALGIGSGGLASAITVLIEKFFG